ncbi:hypothetical protein [Vibrio phage VpKK5]|uniref:RusA-like Holliday junction resolvase n=1 Tax=Vibrio phage VpKK5 TaxID=1538804 RepID=UPI0004F7C922|nr:RusA-like Holliday junction resolvase [Vibrio phage VpKK5]AIM40598.1 hypothetical protein [Vibrio phage VpKK5]
MACTMGQNKGKRGEREIAKILSDAIDEIGQELRSAGVEVDLPQVERNLSQSRSGGFDLAGISWLAPEVKRQEQLNINAWWKQTMKQATESDREPVLFFKQNRKPWRVMTLVFLKLPDGKRVKVRGEISLADWLFYFKEQIKRRAYER